MGSYWSKWENLTIQINMVMDYNQLIKYAFKIHPQVEVDEINK